MSAIRAFTMPKWGIEMTEGLLARWAVREGEPFERGVALAEVETDKITNEIEAEAPGRFARLVAEEGDTLPVGALLAVLAGPEVGADEIDRFVASFRPAGGSAAEAAAPALPAQAEPPPPVIPDDLAISPRARERAAKMKLDVRGLNGSGRGGRVTAQDVEQAARPPAPVLGGGAPLDIRVAPEDPGILASPSARRSAREHGIDLASLAPTGPRGRICRADVLAAATHTGEDAGETAAAPASPAAPSALTPMSPMRRAIARRLTQAWTTIPHFTLRTRADARQLLALKAAAARFLDPKPSLNDLLIRACALALRDVPEANLQVEGEAVRLLPAADIAVAVATARGLVTPVIRGAESLTLAGTASTMRGLVERARAARLTQAELEGGGFTLSNLGAMGVTEFDAIINPPQGAILAVGAVHPALLDTGHRARAVPSLALSLACDHRAIDGALGSRLLAAIRHHIERPDAL